MIPIETKNFLFTNQLNLSKFQFWTQLLVLLFLSIYVYHYFVKVENSTRVEVSLPFNAKLCKISGECGKFCKISGECGEITYKSSGERGEKNLYRLVAVKLHKFKKCPNFVR